MCYLTDSLFLQYLHFHQPGGQTMVQNEDSTPKLASLASLYKTDDLYWFE